MIRGLAARLNDAVVSGAARLRRKRQLRPPVHLWKLNVGSGMVVAPGWTNIDVSLPTLVAPLPTAAHRLVHRIMPRSSSIKRDYSPEQFSSILRQHEFVHYDVRFGLPVPPGSVDFLYSSHFVEHLFREDAERLFRDARRALKPGGVFRICVPDLEHALKLFRSGEYDRALEFFFLGPTAADFTRHRFMWNYPMLRDALLEAGFRDVTRCEYRTGCTPDLGVLDNRPEETLYAEAVA